MSRFHIGSASATKKPVVVSENFNRDAKKGTRNRIQWSAEEKLALKEGLSKYGVGGWKDMLLDVHIGSVVRRNLFRSIDIVCLLFVKIFYSSATAPTWI